MSKKVFEEVTLVGPDTLAERGEPITAIYLILSGNVVRKSPTGMSLLPAGAFIGAENIFLGKHTSTYTYDMQVTAIKIPADNYTEFVDILSDMDLYDTAHHQINRLINRLGMRYRAFYSLVSAFANELFHITEKYQEWCVKNELSTEPPFPFGNLSGLDLEKQTFYQTFCQFEGYKDNPDAFEKIYNESRTSSSKFQLKMLENIYKLLYDVYEIAKELVEFHGNSGASSYLATVIQSELEAASNFIDDIPSPLHSNRYKGSLETFIKNLKEQVMISLELDLEWIDSFSSSGGEAEVIDLSEIEAGSTLLGLCSYAKWSPSKIKNLADSVNAYMELKDKYSHEDEAKKLFKNINELYYKLYTDVFLNYAKHGSKDRSIELFLDFGFLDERLLSSEQADVINSIEELNRNGELKIYRMKDWLKSIFEGKNFPSKNEFDMDYHDTVRKQQIEQQLKPEQVEAKLNDAVAKVKFEIENMFFTNNRLANGLLSSFVPMLYEDLFEADYANKILTREKITSMFDSLKAIDYSIFYREIFYENEKMEIYKELIQTEVLPIIILLPTTGPNGIMWQETTRKRTKSEARFLLPAIVKGNFETMMLKVFAKYRWEFCKKVQGVAWSDISVPSLTANYADYVQFYRKNKELNSEKREQIKLQLYRCRNSIREMFVTDYITWMKYEVNGSLRLNPVNRRILATYCPFPRATRTKLSATPLFDKAMFKFNADNAQHLKVQTNKIKGKENKGLFVPEELYVTLEFYKK